MRRFALLFLLIVSCLLVAVPREMVLLETGTGTWCGYCPGIAMAADSFVENGDNVVVVEYHNGDAYVTPTGTARINYYNMDGYPTHIFDGTDLDSGGSGSQNLYNNLFPRYQTAINQESPVSIDVTGTVDGTTVTMQVTITKDASVPMSTDAPVLHVAVTESHIAESWGGLSEVNFVERMMHPNQNGTALDLSTADSQTIDLTFDIDASWDINHVEFAIFVQNPSTKEVFNATSRNGMMEPRQFGNVTGMVKDADNNPIEGAEVTIGSHIATTDASGNYTISNLIAGNYTATVMADGFVTAIETVSVSAGDNTQNFTLTVDESTPLEFPLTDSPEQQLYPNNTNPFGNSYDDLGWTTINVTENYEIVSVRMNFTWNSLDYPGEGSLKITSPSGTETTLYQASTEGEVVLNLMTPDFAGEYSQGEWIISVNDSYGDGGHMVTDATFQVWVLGAPSIPAPTGLAVDQNGLAIWTAPVGTPLGYNVYLGDTMVAEEISELEYQFLDLVQDQEYTAKVAAVFTEGTSPMTTFTFTYDPVSIGVDEFATALNSNYPNPFNPTTTINFTLAEDSDVEIVIYNAKGQKVKTLADRNFARGNNSLVWNGNSDSNEKVSSGIYFYRMRAGKYTSTKKMILMK